MSQEKLQAIINVLNRTLEQDIRPKVADAMVKMVIASLEEEKGKLI